MRQSLINKLNSNNMSKKVIEQEGVKNVTVKQETTRNLFIDIQGGVTVISSVEKKPQVLIIEPKNRTTVAKAIDPEYQKVIDQNAKLVEALEEAKKDMEWMWENLSKPHTSDHFNIPANAINAIELALQNNKKIEG